MKLISGLVATLLCLTVSAKDVVEKESVTKQQQRKLDEPWQYGTHVYWEFDDGWYEGKIVGYSDGVYTTEWSDGDVEEFSDLAAVDLMVQYAASMPSQGGDGDIDNDEAWDKGTPVLGFFDEDGWWSGVITHYDASLGKYTIEWNDGEVEDWRDSEELDAMVENAAQMPHGYANYQPWDYGQGVYKYFENDGWYEGTITFFENGEYTILWSDSSEEKYDDLDEVDQMVAAYNNKSGDGNSGDPSTDDDSSYPIGTKVRAKYDDEWWWGEVEFYFKGTYTIRWSDGSVDEMQDSEVDDMVANAKANLDAHAKANDDDGKSAGGKFAITLVVLACIAGVSFFAMRWVTRKEELPLDVPVESEFKDDPEKKEIPDVI